MPKYDVRIPATAVFTITVEAESEEEAKEIAFDTPIRLQVQTTQGLQLEELETHECIMEGDVFYGLLNDVEVMEVKE